MSAYPFAEIESKWQSRWDSDAAFRAPDRPRGEKYYCLVMFPYPSGKLHMGHVRNYSIGDVFARFNRMLGKDVMHPIGWDAFGLPAENAAIKNNTHPEQWTRTNIAHMRAQLKSLGISYDWKREFATCDPAYYKWNQWFFIRMWEKGLVYRKTARVNWCPSCSTVLANEQVVQGACWRCDSAVSARDLEQWFFRITAYADELLAGHDRLAAGWPPEVLAMQKNWIGRSTGAEVDFPVFSETGAALGVLKIYTTRPDTLWGVSYMAVAPEHDLLAAWIPALRNKDAVSTYMMTALKKSTIERTSAREKTGTCLEGIHAVNPVNGQKVPVFVADYVLAGYGTGAIMAVPAHDQRDWEFARAHHLPITQVIQSPDSDISIHAWEGEGIMVNSGPFTGTPSGDCAARVGAWLKEKSLGKPAVNFKLKDWLVSRQRYWGTPIPMIHCASCGIVPVPDEQLPVLLPADVSFSGTGQSPLAASPSFTRAACPRCGKPARRETDTMDTFVDSSWYFLRYCDPANDAAPFTPDTAHAWMPVDQYVGGIEHACMHLIYSRFWHRVARDLGLIKSDEPFTRLLTQGMVTLGGSAMSKSKGNVVAPDEIIARYGADTARLFILFAAPPDKQLDWSSDGLEGSWRFLNRVWRLAEACRGPAQNADPADPARELALRRATHSAIRKVTADIRDEQQLNTAISAVMELSNELSAFPGIGKDSDAAREAITAIVLLLAPFVPHICEELWHLLGHTTSISCAPWPHVDERWLACATVELPVQINGRLRGRICAPAAADENQVRSIVEKELSAALAGRPIKKFIFISGKIINIVVS